MSSPSPRQEIREQLARARTQWEQARTEVSAWERENPDHPEREQGLRNALLRAELASTRYDAVLREFTEEVLG